jgi:hypothetical protein
LQALSCTADLVTSEGMLSLGGMLECELPNVHLYSFVGTLTLSTQLQLVISLSIFCFAMCKFFDCVLNFSVYKPVGSGEALLAKIVCHNHVS